MLEQYIKEVPDFPIKGIIYKDIQPLLANAQAFKTAIVRMKQLTNFAEQSYQGFKMIRKAGKLPGQENLISFQYDLEYGSDTIEIEKGKGNVIIVDDVYATGGTMQAAKELCVEAGYNVLDTVCLLDIGLVKDHDTKVLINAS